MCTSTLHTLSRTHRQFHTYTINVSIYSNSNNYCDFNSVTTYTLTTAAEVVTTYIQELLTVQ